MEPMMTVRQVAELLGVHENWVYDQAASGELPSYKLGGARRFDPAEVRGWIAEHRHGEHARGAHPAASTAGPRPAGRAQVRRRGHGEREPKRPEESPARRDDYPNLDRAASHSHDCSTRDLRGAVIENTHPRGTEVRSAEESVHRQTR